MLRLLALDNGNGALQPGASLALLPRWLWRSCLYVPLLLARVFTLTLRSQFPI